MAEASRLFERFFTSVFNVPLMVQPDKLVEVVDVLTRDDPGVDALMASLQVERDTDPAAARGRASNQGGILNGLESHVAVVEVHGSLVHRTIGMQALSGLSSYQSISAAINEAGKNPEIQTVLLDVASHGGVVNGVFDLTDEIYELRKSKNVIAIANDNAFSAAYAIASAANEIWVTRTSGVGSIGVIAAHLDKSEFNKKLGVKYSYIHAGARKKDGNPNEPLSSEAESVITRHVKDMMELFVSAVNRYRPGLTSEAIHETEAGVFFGSRAVHSGLADKLVTIQEAVRGLNELPPVQGGDQLVYSVSQHEPSNEAVTINIDIQEAHQALDKEKTKGGANIMTKEELKAQFPDLYQELVEEGRVTATQELTSRYETEKAELMRKQEGLQSTVLDLEKKETLRAEREIKSESENIWDKALASSKLPEWMHGKVRTHVIHDRFVTAGVFDAGAFKAAVAAEVEDWEKQVKSTAVKGFGTSTKGLEVDVEGLDDDADVKEMLMLSGDSDAAAQYKKGGEK